MLQDCTILKIARIFFDEPTREHYLKEISKKSGIAHTSVKNNLGLLEKEKIIDKIVKKRGEREFPFYIVNKDKKYFKYKKVDNYLRLLNSGLVEFLKDITPTTIIVFGSYSKGEDIEDSDIDLFVECEKKELDVGKFEKKLSREIQIHFNKNLNNLSKELRNNILNGIVLYGNIEVSK